MTLDEFVDSTVAVLQENPVEKFQPTLAFPAAAQIQVIEGIPDGVDQREAIQHVIRRQGCQDREFLFAVRSGANRVTCGHHRPGQPAVFAEMEETEASYEIEPLPVCAWWSV